MAETYKDRIDSKVYGSRLIIYRRPDALNDGFTFRAKIEGQKGYIRRKTGTDNAHTAMLRAEEAYLDLQVRKKGGWSLTKLTCDAFFEDWIDQQRLRLTPSRWAWKRNCWYRYMSGYMGRYNLADITHSVVSGYWDYRLTFWTTEAGKSRAVLNQSRISAKTKSSHNVAPKPAFASLKMEAGLINEFLKAAEKAGHLSRSVRISAQDAVSKHEREDGYRDTFTEEEYRKLTVNLFNYAKCRGKYAGKRINALHRVQREMLRTFVLMAAATGMRVGELKQVRWADLDEAEGTDNKKVLLVRLRAETSKVRRGRSVVSFSGNILDILNEWKAISTHKQKNDLVFYSIKKDGSIGTVDLTTAFKNFLRTMEVEGETEGLRFSSQAKARTLYSLRHFYAITRLKHGVDVFRLAENMGTSVDQIRNHYGRHISGEAYISELTRYQSRSANKAKNEALEGLARILQSGVLDEEQALKVLKEFTESRK